MSYDPATCNENVERLRHFARLVTDDEYFELWNLPAHDATVYVSIAFQTSGFFAYRAFLWVDEKETGHAHLEALTETSGYQSDLEESEADWLADVGNLGGPATEDDAREWAQESMNLGAASWEGTWDEFLLAVKDTALEHDALEAYETALENAGEEL